MALASGTQFGPYEIQSLIGAGGMGEVYRARDTRLGRDVALKVLPEAFARDAQRMARFRREAQVLASLNHPNIAAIYGFEETGAHALAMELVDGPTLAERIKQSEITLDETLTIAKQICEAMEYAHERGIIHRDLKPSNVKINGEGSVKVLDFGLAKALDGNPAATDISSSPTISRMATQEGIILGSAPYMSPEQAKGKSVDRRTDIWAFGCVLYEMLSGKMAFSGETATDTLAAVIKSEPDWSQLPAATPPAIRGLLQRCLKKDPRQRLQAIGEARIALEDASSGLHEAASSPDVGAPQFSAPTWRRTLPWAVAALLAGALISGVAVWRFAAPASAPSAMHFSAVTNFAGVQAQPALSPDGRSVAFVSSRDGHYNIYVGLVQGGNLVQITHDPNLKSRPAWSPDGTTLAYARLNESGIWDVWEVPALGGTSRRIILNAADPTWSPDGRSLAYQNRAEGGIWTASVSGENPHQLVEPLSGWFETDLRFSPNGQEIAFVTHANGPYGELEVAGVPSGKIRPLTRDDALALSPAWSPDGKFLFFASSRGGTINIWKIAAAGGLPQQITAGQGDDAQLDVSSDGKRIVFSTWRESTNIAQLDLAAKPGQQALKLLTTDLARSELAPVYSPDGKHIAYFSNLKGAEQESIWVSNADGSNPVQLIQDSASNVFPRWTPDGQHLVYVSFSSSGDEYRSIPISGGAPKTVVRNIADLFVDVGPDGRLLYRNSKGQMEIFDPRDGKTETHNLFHASADWAPLGWSPDERSIAYIVAASREGDPLAGLWVDDLRNPPRQVFRGWVESFACGPLHQIYFMEGKPDLHGVLWKVGWDGQGLAQTSMSIPMVDAYWEAPGENSQDSFAVSPDGRYLAFSAESVLEANIGMIENVR